MGESLKKYVFLGGTCNDSTWRDEIIPMLVDAKISYYNPVVDVWNDEAKKNEDIAKKFSAWELYVLTPEMTGVYSIAEMMYKAFTAPEKLIICVPNMELWEASRLRSVMESVALAQEAGKGSVSVCSSLEGVTEQLKYMMYED